MEKEGMVVSRDNDFEHEVSRRRYSITAWGNACLECMANAIGQYGEEIDLFFRLFDEHLASEAAPRASRSTERKGNQE
jgi:hypothetical protein